ncbi:hypothetical protein RvY_05476 [Ramazzottius varieornatus]|uniref:Ubiquitin carboxyl-terminal hydrolase n=1 Tax=Ramazzottius varieornatus TaxID=947166 RepID=A0A1D1UY79_RAMVA|nr:hypothetical protein RvY_05476 [Ramazzottius varieornatus]
MVTTKRKQEPSEVVPSSDNSMDVDEKPEVSDKKAELRELKRLLDSDDYPLVANEKWYIISSKYLTQLKQHLEEGGSNQTTNPGAVNNKELIVRSDDQNVLKDDLVEKHDYDFVSETTWNKIVNVFGVVDDAQTIEVRTYESPTFDIKIEARPLAFQCALYPDVNNVKTIRASRSVPIKECTDMLLDKFDVSKSMMSRFWVSLPGEKPYLPNIEDEKTKLNELDLSPKHQIIVETKVPDSTWALDDEEALEKLQAELKSLHESPTGNGTARVAGQNFVKSYNLRSGHTNTRDGSAGINGYDDSPHTPGLVGLGNLGNTCFMNSSLQCLSNVPELTNYFLTNNYTEDVNGENPLGKGGAIANVYAHLLESLWKKQSGGSVYPTDFKKTLSRFTSLFNGAQQDAQESLQYIVDCLHEDLNRVKKKPYFQEDENDKRDDETASREAWERYIARDNSVIVDLFHGQIRSTIQCPDCKKLSVTFDPVCYYSLPLPSTKTKKLSYIYVPYDASKPVSRHKLSNIPNSANISEFLAHAGKQISVQPEYLLPIVLYDNRVDKILKRKQSVDEMQDRDKVFLYQLAHPFDDESHVPAICYLRKIKDADDPSLLTNHGTLFDIPFVISVPKDDKLSAKDLYRMMYSKIQGRLKPTDEAAPSENGVAGDRFQPDADGDIPVEQLERAYGPTEDAEAKENDTPYALFVPNVFTVSTINSFGNAENARIERHQKEPVALPPRNDLFLSANFAEGSVQKHYIKHQLPEDDEKFGRSVGSSADTVELRDCFQLYISPEKLTGNNLWRCPQCKEEKPAMKKLDLWRLPKYMFVHLKRFQYNRFCREKLSTKVKFPLTGLDLTDLVGNKRSREPAVYDLIAVSCHSGGLGGGHYWAMCKNVKDGHWYKFDDSTVRPASEGDVMNETTPYILIYKRQGGNERSSGTSSVPNEEPMDTV